MNSDKLSIVHVDVFGPLSTCIATLIHVRYLKLFCGIHGYVGVRVHMSADFGTALCTCIRNIPFYYTCVLYTLCGMYMCMYYMCSIYIYMYMYDSRVGLDDGQSSRKML